MSEPRALVEHFFRHEFGRLCAVLTRSLGARRLAFVEDVVQAALVRALETRSRRGVPEDPAGWLYRTARNLAIDALRRERTHAQALPRMAADAEREWRGQDTRAERGSPLEAHFADEIGDEPLRLLFICCHEAVPAESRVAMALRTLRGFGTAEIARALLTTEANVQKRIERARDRLRELDVAFDTLSASANIPPPSAPGEKPSALPLPAPIKNSCIAASPPAGPKKGEPRIVPPPPRC